MNSELEIHNLQNKVIDLESQIKELNKTLDSLHSLVLEIDGRVVRLEGNSNIVMAIGSPIHDR